ncbi:serine/threonine-protein kinase NIM1-like [Sinocyclocheilus anshuiensis]|uniref:serine/threonine-protein kinase NIM1-like n=1 Tax=Sinocyclocheilus anshuiensis TaxID=1608454 RepID=UPI0007BAC2CF|nr:PREDICTED: serine/threonine-protein kinase NIM1-like [Sinocyclocheilus anshuiensis]
MAAAAKCLQGQVRCRRRCIGTTFTLTDSSECGSEPEEDADPSKHLTPLEKLTLEMCNDEDIIKELTVGRRVGFYKVRGQIGCGNFSKVKLAIHALTKDKVAIKIMDKMRLDLQTQRMLSKEISNMERLYHPNLLQLYEVLETPSRLYLVLEFTGGGDVHTRISSGGKLSDQESKTVFAQILSAVKYMHENNIIHRDLKAENVLYTTNSCIKVADFGFSTRVNNLNQALDTYCGSPPYAAPELFKYESYIGPPSYNGPPVDVWAMGVLLFLMVTGTLPFRADTVAKLHQSVLEGDYVLPTWVSAPCQRLIRGILKPEPSERCALDQMLGCEWLLPVELFRPIPPLYQLNSIHLIEAGPGELDGDQEEVKGILEKLGVTQEHILNNQGKRIRSPITGVYRILLHGVKRNNGAESAPIISGVVKDPKRDSLRAYRNLRHSSKLCVLS